MTRRTSRHDAARKNGASFASPIAADAALVWLARHQEADGSWAIRKHGGTASESDNVAVTGLALLAFLAGGQTEQVGKHKETVRRAVYFLIAQQRPDGGLAPTPAPTAEADRAWPLGGQAAHAVAALALAEAYGMNPRSSRTQKAAQAALDRAVALQADGGGWSAASGGEPDLATTVWFAWLLRAAMRAGLRVPDRSFVGAMNFVNSVTQKTGGDYSGGLSADQPGAKPTALSAAQGMFVRICLGEPKGSPNVSAAAELLQKNLPAWEAEAAGCRFFYWQFGTYAMFQIGGSFWDAWNPPMRDMLVKYQRRGGDNDGSWDPVGADGAAGGRVLTTALGALSLEVYYSYLAPFCTARP